MGSQINLLWTTFDKLNQESDLPRLRDHCPAVAEIFRMIENGEEIVFHALIATFHMERHHPEYDKLRQETMRVPAVVAQMDQLNARYDDES